MIVVTAMPVVNTKARTITTKIVFMTLALSHPCLQHGRTGRAFCDRHHGTPFFSGHTGALKATKCLYSLTFRFHSAGAGVFDRSQNSMLESARALAGALLQSRCLVAFDRMRASATMPAELEAA